MEVRKLSKEDWALYKSLRLLSLQETPQLFVSSVEDELSLTDEQWMSRVTPSDIIYIAGAFIGSKLIAVAGFQREYQFNRRHKSNLWGIFVDYSYRGRGLATELIIFILNETHKMKGIAQVRLAVGRSNSAAIALFQRCGFKPYGIEADAIRVSGRSYDELLMIYIIEEEQTTHRAK